MGGNSREVSPHLRYANPCKSFKQGPPAEPYHKKLIPWTSLGAETQVFTRAIKQLENSRKQQLVAQQVVVKFSMSNLYTKSMGLRGRARNLQKVISTLNNYMFKQNVKPWSWPNLKPPLHLPVTYGGYFPGR